MKKITYLSILLSTMFMFQGCDEKPKDEKQLKVDKVYSISTGSTSGAYYKEGQTIGKALSEQGVSVKVVSSEGGEQNGRRVMSGITNFGFIQKDTHNLLSTMDGNYSNKVNVVSSLGEEAILFIVNKNSDIKSEDDIKNNKVKIAITSKSAGANSSLNTMGKLNKVYSGKDVVYKDFDQAINELNAKTIDVLMIVQSTKISNDKLKNLSKQSNLSIIDISDSNVINTKINGKKVYNECKFNLDGQSANTICTEALLISDKSVDSSITNKVLNVIEKTNLK